MNSPMFSVLLLILGVVFFQPTHQYRLSKRELTEYDLTKFIVGTCSAKNSNNLIQDLCDQTFQSALMGTFPFLTYYCQTIGAGMSYCEDVNRHMATKESAGAKSFAYRRLARSLRAEHPWNSAAPDTKIDTDLEEKLIMQMCMITTGKSPIPTEPFCERKLVEIQHGQHPGIRRVCQTYPDFAYCQRIEWHTSSPSSSSSQAVAASAAFAPESLAVAPVDGRKQLTEYKHA